MYYTINSNTQKLYGCRSVNGAFNELNDQQIKSVTKRDNLIKQYGDDIRRINKTELWVIMSKKNDSML